MDNLHHKGVFSAGWKYFQFDQYDDLEDRKDGIFFLQVREKY